MVGSRRKRKEIVLWRRWLKKKFNKFILIAMQIVRVYSGKPMRIALFGDIHGHWRDFRNAVVDLHSKANIDLVLQCGDAQPIRNEDDLEYMHCPANISIEWKSLGSRQPFGLFC